MRTVPARPKLAQSRTSTPWAASRVAETLGVVDEHPVDLAGPDVQTMAGEQVDQLAAQIGDGLGPRRQPGGGQQGGHGRQGEAVDRPLRLRGPSGGDQLDIGCGQVPEAQPGASEHLGQ